VRCSAVDMRAMLPSLRDAEVRRLVDDAAQTPFDLTVRPLFRATLVQLSPVESVFVFVIHHIIADSWSLGILFRELSTLYQDAVQRRPFSLPELPVQYADYSIWQRKWLKEKELGRLLKYWKQQLQDLPTLNLPTDRPRPLVQSFRGAQIEILIPARTVHALNAVARDTEATPFMVLLTVFFILLQRYTGQDDLVVGVPIANRNRIELEGVIGFFANSLVLRANLSGNPSFREALGRVRKMALDAYSYPDLPFSRLVAELRPEQDLSRNPLFQASFQLLSSDSGTLASQPHPSNRALAPERGAAIFDLVLNLWENGREVRGLFEFNTDLFERSTIEKMAGHYRRLLDAAVEEPNVAIAALPMLSESERRGLMLDWNATENAFPNDVCIHELFDEQVKRTPHAIAVANGSQNITYEHLQHEVERLAARLQESGIGQGKCIGVLLDPTIELVVALIAILKTGNAYVPFDPETPDLRLMSMIQDAGVEWALTDSKSASRLEGTQITIICLNENEGSTGLNSHFTPVEVKPTALAYVIFTSGSTGRPKGAMIQHRGVVNYLSWCRQTYPLEAGTGAPLSSAVQSDMSVTSLFLPLVSGKTVTLLDDGDLIESLDRVLRDGPRFSFVKLTPSHLQALRNLSVGRDPPANTAAFIVGGEALRGEALDLWSESAPDIAVYNEYGPTETVVGCCVYAVRVGEIAPGPVPIGRPIANTRLYVLDRHGSPVPVGVPGELYIGGAGVALGYINEIELTNAQFVLDPFSKEPGQRLYRTGDLVRYRADGNLEFLGRIDRQVKIRGYRIEPGEVEAAIRQHPFVADAAVLTRDVNEHDQRLVAYVVPAEHCVDSPLMADLLDFLRLRLPAYMVPQSLIVTKTIPLTSSGKVDLRALEMLLSRREVRAGNPAPPRTSLEELILRIFSDVLKVQNLGIQDDFFADLGGHSLLATKAIARMRELLRIEVPLQTLFEAPTVERIAKYLLKNSHTSASIEQAAELLLRVLKMSDDEVRVELAAKS
jgi:amino acid adenylation domain-containing protein